MRRTLGRLGLLAAIAAAGSPAAAGGAMQAAVDALAKTYIAAWDRADPAALGAQFAPDGDFINPAGTYARGPAAVAAFYRAAFAQGYAGSGATFRPMKVRRLAAGVVAIDGEWSISGAHDPSGAVRPLEAGIAAAILVRRAGVWKIALLREQEGAAKIAD
jgi:uncharacterized protein (TIGR02246 family)